MTYEDIIEWLDDEGFFDGLDYEYDGDIEDLYYDASDYFAQGNRSGLDELLGDERDHFIELLSEKVFDE